ncbi:hypothetical protein ND860_18425 [Leptospira levettii]|uniref:Uncharacterized protein n=1 Tax=Leptospira levettii TaxID=2023178 RepID=A0AAW5V6J8_9LEPT|nr:hypothetical protein [Leptospira levettii]MCW7467838.1 hypothetical protein [Leptospira levettii]MCW7498518.1 hypothetical protein [Leptospira levettii]MCW7513469.1 hypothetical protein [Leptospira levettii]MCW7517265.1 hypothetical protein [Leptospira levettii]
MKFNYDFEKLDKISFRFRNQNSENFQEMLNFGFYFENLSKDNQILFKEALPNIMYKKLLSFSGLLAEYAIYTKDEKYIRTGVVFHIIEDFRIDYRENIRYLILLNYSSNLLGINFNNLILNNISLCSEKAETQLRNFCLRDNSLNSLDKFNILFTLSENYPTFVHVEN